MFVKVDYRERKRLEQAEEYYTSKNHSFESCRLSTGDFVFDDKVVFEYKTYSDLFNSINTHRVFDEALRQAEAYPYHFVIIVGTDKTRKNELYRLYKLGVRFTMKQYYGAVARLNTYTNVIYAPSTRRAFQIMECQAEKSLDSKPIVRKPTVSTNNPAFNLLMFLPDVREGRARLIVESLDLKNYDDLRNVTKEDLIGIKGIGDKTADNILNHLKGDYSL